MKSEPESWVKKEANCPVRDGSHRRGDCGRIIDSFSGGELSSASVLLVIRARGLQLWRLVSIGYSVSITVIKKLCFKPVLQV